MYKGRVNSPGLNGGVTHDKGMSGFEEAKAGSFAAASTVSPVHDRR